MAGSAVKMFFYSHKNKFSQKQEHEIIKELMRVDDKLLFLRRFKREAITPGIWCVALFSTDDAETKAEIIHIMPKGIIKQIKNADMLCEIIKYNPRRFDQIDFEFFMQEQNKLDYAKILRELGLSLSKHIQALKFRGDLIAEDQEILDVLVSMDAEHDAEITYAMQLLAENKGKTKDSG